jgi:ribonuclease HI
VVCHYLLLNIHTYIHTYTHTYIPPIRAPTDIPHNVINIFTDGSKITGKVGTAAVVMKDDIFLHQSKYKLHERCSNNQAEDVAIRRALEQIQNLKLAEDAEKVAVVNTDSKVTLDTLQNRKNKHYTLIENIRKEMRGWRTYGAQCFLTG